jgi:hypothetical protein
MMASSRFAIGISLFAGIVMSLGAGCTSVSGPAATSGSSSTSQAVRSAAGDRSAAYAKVQSELSAFLDMWRSQGYAAASAAYLVPGEQVGSGETAPTLVTGRVARMQPGDWISSSQFTVGADLDLSFRGNSGAWGNGVVNSRIVKATGRSGAIPYVLEFATGP